MFDYHDVVYRFRGYSPNGEIIETQELRQAYYWARQESRRQLREAAIVSESRPVEMGEIILVSLETGEILAKFPGADVW